MKKSSTRNKTQVSVQVVRPTERAVGNLGPRHHSRSPHIRQLQYSFTVAATELTIDPATLLQEVLYESEMESQLWMLLTRTNG